MDLTDGSSSDLGVYGLRVDGLPQATKFLSSVGEAPTLRIRRVTAQFSEPDRLDEHEAVLRLAGGQGSVRVERDTLTADIALIDNFSDEAILHPFMSGSAAIANRWLGRDPFHAGAFAVDGLAWSLIGDKGQGKSSTLGYLASQGVTVLTDDLLIIDHGDALAGPAFIDLRPDAAAQLQTGRDLGVLGARSRFRLDIPTPPARIPLAGWIILAWGDSVELREVPLPERLRLLFANRAVWRNPPDPGSFIRHAALPMWELRRPKNWKVLPQLQDLLLAQLD